MTKKSAPVHAGLDIAKATLQLHLQGRQHVLPNSPAGRRKLVTLVGGVPGAQVLCEATGGYERAVVAARHAAALPVSVLNPAHVRHFALAQGQRAKNDPLDAALLTACGSALQPQPTPKPNAVLAELRALVPWRNQLKDQLGTACNPGAHATLPCVQKQQAKLVKPRTTQRAQVQAQLTKVLAQSPATQTQVQRLAELDGVRTLTAVSVLSQRPELGQLNRGAAAALAGLAPWTRQSGPWEGQRHSGGGRAAVRRALYLSAVVLARLTETSPGKFYQRLRAAGKPAKVALTAVLRKLLLQMNQALKPAQAEPQPT